MDEWDAEAMRMETGELMDAFRSLWERLFGEGGAVYDGDDVHLFEAVEEELERRGFSFVDSPESEAVGRKLPPLVSGKGLEGRG